MRYEGQLAAINLPQSGKVELNAACHCIYLHVKADIPS